MDAGDPDGLEVWGGFMEASRLVGTLRGRSAGRGGGRIDSFETHLAERVSDDAFGV